MSDAEGEMSAAVRPEWTRASDRAWADRLRMRLALVHGGKSDLADEVVGEVHQACAETGRSAEELFGPADVYAAEVAEQRIPVEVRAQADLDGSLMSKRWTVLAYGTGGPGIVMCLLVLLREGWTIGVTPAGLALLVAILAGAAMATGGLLERHAGALRRGWVLWTASVVVVVVGAWFATTLRDREPLGTVAVLLPLAACVALVAVAPRLPDRAVPDDDLRARPADAWFDRLAGVLRGRYYVPCADVAAHVAEARTYWCESGTEHPEDEFGTPSVYALRLVQGSRRPHRARRRLRATARTGLAVVALGLVAGTVVNGGTAADYAWRIGMLALFTALAVHDWRQADDPAV